MLVKLGMPFAAATVVGPSSQLQGADGPIRQNSRVQTQWTRDEGGNDEWYAGTVVSMTMTGHVNIRYDDGDSWTGSATEVWLLDHNHPPKNLRRYAWELAIVKVKSTFSVPPMCVIFVILVLH